MLFLVEKFCRSFEFLSLFFYWFPKLIDGDSATENFGWTLCAAALSAELIVDWRYPCFAGPAFWSGTYWMFCWGIWFKFWFPLKFWFGFGKLALFSNIWNKVFCWKLINEFRNAFECFGKRSFNLRVNIQFVPDQLPYRLLRRIS